MIHSTEIVKEKKLPCETANWTSILRQIPWPSNFLKNYIPFPREQAGPCQSCLEQSKAAASLLWWGTDRSRGSGGCSGSQLEADFGTTGTG